MRVSVLGLVGAGILLASQGSAREWRDSSGQHSIEADLVSTANGKVWLKKPSGEVIPVSIDQLSITDREYIRNHASQSAQPTPPPRAEFSLVDLTAMVEPAVVRIDTGRSIGSGFIVEPEGMVVTNYHVVEDARAIMVSFKDGSSERVIGYLGIDTAKDIVLLSLGAKRTRPALTLRKDLPQKGETVAAFGMPQGLDFSVSEGVVSAIRTDQEIEKSVQGLTTRSHPSLDMFWIQTTAAISGGNSGGPLVDMHGEVVGINTKTRTQGQNLNFAASCQDIASLVELSLGKPVQSLARLPSHTRPSSPRHMPTSISSSGGFPQIVLPSGNTFSNSIVEIPGQWPECSLSKDSGIRELEFPNGEQKAMHGFLNARLHGPSLLLNEDGAKRWAADYYEGDRDGSLRVWNENSQMALFGQYVRGGKKGFVCVFDTGMPWLVQEWDKDQLQAEYLINWNGRVPTALQVDQISDQATLTRLAAARKRLTEVEEQLLAEETEVKQDLAEWFREQEQEIRQGRVAASNLRKRSETLGALKARRAAEKASLGRRWQKAITGR